MGQFVIGKQEGRKLRDNGFNKPWRLSKPRGRAYEGDPQVSRLRQKGKVGGISEIWHRSITKVKQGQADPNQLTRCAGTHWQRTSAYRL